MFNNNCSSFAENKRLRLNKFHNELKVISCYDFQNELKVFSWCFFGAKFDQDCKVNRWCKQKVIRGKRQKIF
jgi:hypothetical protein